MRVVAVLVVEDSPTKRDHLVAEIVGYFGACSRIDSVATFAEATQRILTRAYDLIILDLLLPRRVGDIPTDVSEELIDHLVNSEVNRLATVVAISEFDDIVSQRREAFNKAGIFLIGYSKEEEWKACLSTCMQKVGFRTVYDFVIVCALELERAAYGAVREQDFEYGELLNIGGLDAREMRIGDLEGVCFVQPRMGLVDASIVAARALQTLNPRLICMSGICGGFASEVELGTLIVTDVTWEHQAGKWDGPQFEIRSYQESLGIETRTALSQIVSSDPQLTQFASAAHEVQMPSAGAVLKPTVSGSAVIASTEYGATIRQQHGKVAGVDMEIYGLHRAAALHGGSVICFSAKTVVDHADERKSSDLQQSGSILSARFTVRAIATLLR